VTALHELTAEEAAGLGPLLRGLSAALGRVVGCTKTYVMLFAEAEGFAHAHFHVVPRMPDQPEDLRGPRIFALLGVPAQERVPDQEMDRLATEIGAILVEPPAEMSTEPATG
jgi:diadenosine tetraphosphate (Ap4A) HIT family hydrolase